MRVTTEGAG